MISYCNANEAAMMVKEYWKKREQEERETADKLYSEVMICINDEIVSAASVGQGQCEISLSRLSPGICTKIRNYLRDKVVRELTEVLGYRLVYENDTLYIVWCTDV